MVVFYCCIFQSISVSQADYLLEQMLLCVTWQQGYAPLVRFARVSGQDQMVCVVNQSLHFQVGMIYIRAKLKVKAISRRKTLTHDVESTLIRCFNTERNN